MSVPMRRTREHRQFPRLQAPACCRALGAWATGPYLKVIDLSEQGIRVHSDVARPNGERLELEVLLPDSSTIALAAIVVWSEPLPPGDVAAYDIGLSFVDPTPAAQERLAAVLKHEE